MWLYCTCVSQQPSVYVYIDISLACIPDHQVLCNGDTGIKWAQLVEVSRFSRGYPGCDKGELAQGRAGLVRGAMSPLVV